MKKASVRASRSYRLYYIGLTVVYAVLAWVALILPLRDQLRLPALEPGQVAAQDYIALEPAVFTSEVLSEQKRAEIERNIQPVYSTPDTNIARQQLESLQTTLAYITSVRADSHAGLVQKLGDLSAMDDLQLEQAQMAAILSLSDARWQLIGQEANITLERVMRDVIQPENLDSLRARVPNLVSLALNEEEAVIAGELAADFVVPNSFLNEELTLSARQAALEAVAPVSQTYIAGQTVAQRGQVLTAVQIEALQELGLIQPPIGWQELASAAALVLLMTSFLLVYFNRERALLGKPRRLGLIAALFMIFLYTARLIIPTHVVIPYAFPLSAFGLTVMVLFGTQVAMISTLPLALFTAYGLPNALDLTIYYLVGGLIGLLVLGRGRRIAAFFWTGAAVALSGIMVVLAYSMASPTMDWLGIATLAGVSLLNGLVTASLAVLLQFFLAQLLGETTTLQLMDLTRPDHPLLQKVLRDAPGTYQHSLQVANLAEQAAEQIGADTLLTRVGALYHDAGKSLNPYFFIENQIPGMDNPHDNLDPTTSARIIIDHVLDGLTLAREHNLPRRALAFISEHHGTMIARYQYIKAVQAAGGDENKVSKAEFQYPGPRPRSRETAILMLADGCEARVRAERPKDEEELRQIIKSVIDNRLSSGQLEDTSLTLHDLQMIAETFSANLRGIYHPRIIYPQLDAPASSEIETRPALVIAPTSAKEAVVAAPADKSTSS